MSMIIDVPATQVRALAKADVVVLGGGTAGFCAAIAAARAGARTVLVERSAYLGGCNTATYNTGPGFTHDDDKNQIVGGIGWEFVERMVARGSAVLNPKARGITPQLYPPDTKLVVADMVTAAGVEVFLHCWAGDVLTDEATGAIRAVLVQSKSGRQAVVGKVFVDCTADADVAASAGATFDLALPTDEESWQTSIDLTVANIDPEKVLRWCAENREKLQGGGPRNDPAEDHGGVRLGFALHLTNGNYHYVKKAYGDAHPAELESHQGEGNYPTLKLMVRRTASRVQGNVEIDGTDVRQITWAEIEGRRRAYANLEYLRRTIPGCEDAFVVGDNPLGVRVSRRVHGEYRVTIDDLVGNARFDDVVALNARVIDKHLAGDKTEFTYLPGNHDVPLRALLPRGQVNLLVGGRCLSCDEQSHGSLRGAATCWATGHAAGAAAAVAARDAGGRVRGVDVGDVQRLLLGQGAILSTSGQTFPAGATGGALAAVAGGTH